MLLSADPADRKLVSIFSDPDIYFRDDEEVEIDEQLPTFEFVVEGYPPMEREDSDEEEILKNHNLVSDSENSNGNEQDFPDTDEEFQFAEDEDDDKLSTDGYSSDDDFDE